MQHLFKCTDNKRSIQCEAVESIHNTGVKTLW